VLSKILLGHYHYWDKLLNKTIMGILLRLIKVVFGICLIPVWLIVVIFGYLIVIPILLVADLFKYIITGKAGLAEWFVLDSDSLFSFEGLTFGWASYLSELYDKKFLKKS
jgi:hypothetical protein